MAVDSAASRHSRSSEAPGDARPGVPARADIGERLKRALPLIILAVAAAAATVLIYALFWGTARGIALDSAGLTPLDEASNPLTHGAVEEVLKTISVQSLLIVGGTALGVALLRRRPLLAGAALAVLVGANVTTQVMKFALARLDLVPGEFVKELPGTFPSGHATVAMSIALAAVLVAPRRLQLVAALAGGAYAAAVGVALLALGWHYSSDVAAGYLVALGWALAAGAAVAVFDPDARHAASRRPRRVNWTLAIAFTASAGLVFMTLALAAMLARPGLAQSVRLHTTAVFAAAAVAGLSLGLAGVFALALRRSAATTTGGAAPGG